LPFSCVLAETHPQIGAFSCGLTKYEPQVGAFSYGLAKYEPQVMAFSSVLMKKTLHKSYLNHVLTSIFTNQGSKLIIAVELFINTLNANLLKEIVFLYLAPNYKKNLRWIYHTSKVTRFSYWPDPV
jgi:hypothetical protein